MEDVPESHKLAARPVFEVWNGADTARLDDVADGLGYFAQRIGPLDLATVAPDLLAPASQDGILVTHRVQIAANVPFIGVASHCRQGLLLAGTLTRIGQRRCSGGGSLRTDWVE